ncbi:hypothetical protein [Actinomadura sp. WMMA1423]|uniref:D-alanyl-D-alanine carboxypeptidase n=1 Tax=Actinomadura sp. WMMA1423 TaxID=2591108 RepID=UPI001F0DA9E7|nr:hypothetical protein [Actinomadura sp. WMMA1423]
MGDDAELGEESARNRTAEFRVPAKVDLTRPDIAVRRPAKPQDEPGDEAADASEEEASGDEAGSESGDEAGGDPGEKPSGPTWYVQFTPPSEDEEPERDEPSPAAPPPPETKPWRATSSSAQDEEPSQEEDAAASPQDEAPAEEPPAEEPPGDDATQATAPQPIRPPDTTQAKPQERPGESRATRDLRAPRHGAPPAPGAPTEPGAPAESGARRESGAQHTPGAPPQPGEAPPSAATPRTSGRHAARPATERPQAAPSAQSQPQGRPGDVDDSRGTAAPPTPTRHTAPPDTQRPQGQASARPQPQQRPGDGREARGDRARHAQPETEHPQPAPATQQETPRDVREARENPAPPRLTWQAAPPSTERPQGAASAPPQPQEHPGDVRETRGRGRQAPPDAGRSQSAPAGPQEASADVREEHGSAAPSIRSRHAAPPGTERRQGPAPRTGPAPRRPQERPGDGRDVRGNRALPAPQRHSAPPEAESPHGAAAPAPPQDAPGDVRGSAPSSAGPTRVERLPDLSQGGPWEASLPAPAARTSGQWSVPWDGTAAPPGQPGPPLPAPGPPLPAPAPATAEKRKGKRRWLVVVAAMLVLVAGVVGGQLLRPPPEPTVRLAIASNHTFPGQAPTLPWPAAGQAVLYVDGLGTMGSSGGAVPTPTASVAKVMTAYVYLREHPLESGRPGPVLTVSPQAAALIPARKRRGESLLGVTANQRLTQRKALEALLIISANDVAHELARWDSGGDQPFVAKMNDAARTLGMTGTRYTDPSGYDSGTVSTAADQVKLLRAAMKIPAFTEIVNNRMYVPDGGGSPRQGGNFILGRNGVVGGKTGYTDAAGGNFVFAAHRNVGGTQTLIVGAVMGQRSPSAADAVNAAEGILVAAEQALVTAPLARAGDTVAWLDDGLGGRKALTATSQVSVVGWPGLTVPVGFDGDPPAEPERGTKAGVVEAGAARVPVKVGTGRAPSVIKRLTRLS